MTSVRAAALTGGGVLPELTYRAAIDAFGVQVRPNFAISSVYIVWFLSP